MYIRIQLKMGFRCFAAGGIVMKRKNGYLHTILIGAAFLLVFFFGISNFIASAHENTDDQTVYKYYTSIQIQSGDTLWDIAEKTMTSEYDSTAEYVDVLKEMNGLTSDQIEAGQYLTVAYNDTVYRE